MPSSDCDPSGSPSLGTFAVLTQPSPSRVRGHPAELPSDGGREQARAALHQIAGLSPNWDFHGASAADPRVLAWSDAFLCALPEGIRMPRVTIATDGEVGLFWETHEVFIDASITPQGTLSYFARSPAGEHSDEAPWTGQLPSELLNRLPTLS